MKRKLQFALGLMLAVSITGCGSEDPLETTNTPEPSIEMSQEMCTEKPSEPLDETTEQVAEKETPENTEEPAMDDTFSTDFYDYSSMADLLEEHNIIFGAKINSSTQEDYALQNLISTHFHSVTASNEMKAYTLLDQKASMKSADGMPCMNFEKSNCIIEVASITGTKIRGHVLVWDANMSDWFFREGYKSNGDYVDANTLKKRLQSYISQTITYYETNYPGMVYCWDVVNEAVGDSNKNWDAGDARHIRTTRSDKPNMFYEIIGSDYVELSFLYARDTVEALQAENPNVDIKLFYNDYSTFSPTKRDAICALIDSINSYAKDDSGNYRKLVDGVGMQGYIGGYGTQNGCMSISDINKIEEAIWKFWEHGVESQITEMAVRNYKNDEDTMQSHAKYYERLMKRLVEVNAGEEKPLTGISIWGLYDTPYIDSGDYAYRQNGPYCGLFNEAYEVKEAFSRVHSMLESKKSN